MMLQNIDDITIPLSSIWPAVSLLGTIIVAGIGLYGALWAASFKKDFNQFRAEIQNIRTQIDELVKQSSTHSEKLGELRGARHGPRIDEMQRTLAICVERIAKLEQKVGG